MSNNDPLIPNCVRCLKRPHSEGGKGSCPFLKTWSPDYGGTVQQRYADMGDHECGAFVLGSRKQRIPVVLPEGGLF